MILTDLVIVVFALLSFNLWQLAITGYARLPSAFFPADDILGDSHYARLARIKRRFLSTWTIPLGLTVLAMVLTPWWRWGAVDAHNLLRPMILIAGGIVTWRAITMDVELAGGTSSKVIAESGAVVEYILDTFGAGRLRPSVDSEKSVETHLAVGARQP